MAITAQEVFNETRRSLSPTERLRLAALILGDLTQANLSVVDDSSSWTGRDQRELASFSLHYASTLYPEEEELV